MLLSVSLNNGHGQASLRLCPDVHSLAVPCVTQSGNYVYENFGKLTPEGGPAPTAGEEVQLRYSDGSFAEVQVPQPQPGELAPGPAPTLNATKLATQISSAPALPPTAGSALAPSPTSSS